MKPLHFFSPLAAAVLLSGCSDDTSYVAQPTPVRMLELATITALEPATCIDVYRSGTDEPIQMVSSRNLNGGTIGQRILVYYEAAVADTVLRPVPITITGASAVPGGDIIVMDADKAAGMAMTGYQILSRWQTGPYLNFQMMIRTNDRTVFTLAADSSTLDADTVLCRFVGQNLPEGNAYVDRRTYASFDTRTLLTRPDQQIRIIP